MAIDLVELETSLAILSERKALRGQMDEKKRELAKLNARCKAMGENVESDVAEFFAAKAANPIAKGYYYLLGDTIHDIIQPRDEDGGLVGGEAVLIAASTLLYRDGSYVGLLGGLAYATVTEGGTGTYNIAIDTSHVDCPGVGGYLVWYDDGLIGDPLTGGVDYFGGPYVVYAAADFKATGFSTHSADDVADVVLDDFTIDTYAYDAYNRPVSAVKTYDSGAVVDIAITYGASGITEYSETER